MRYYKWPVKVNVGDCLIRLCSMDGKFYLFRHTVDKISNGQMLIAKGLNPFTGTNPRSLRNFTQWNNSGPDRDRFEMITTSEFLREDIQKFFERYYKATGKALR